MAEVVRHPSEANPMDIGSVINAAAAGRVPAISLDSPSPESRAQVAKQRELIQAVKALNGTQLFGSHSELTFVFDRETHRALVRVVDRKTGEVTMQVPPEYVIRMAEQTKTK